jgi:hypothetical protein
VLILAIDPGVTGAVASMDVREVNPVVESVRLFDMPSVETTYSTGRKKHSISAPRLLSLIRSEIINRAGEDVRIVVEDVRPMGKLPANAIASLMHSRGVIEGVLAGWSYEITWADPYSWKSWLGLRRDKAKSLHVARRLYPAAMPLISRVCDHNRAEALLMGHWALRNVFYSPADLLVEPA